MSNTNRVNRMREVFRALFEHHTCAHLRSQHKDIIIRRISGVDKIPDWDLHVTLMYELPHGYWEMRVFFSRIDDEIEETSGDKVATFDLGLSIRTSEVRLERVGNKPTARQITPVLWLGAELDDLVASVMTQFGNPVREVVMTAAEIAAERKRIETDRITTRLRETCASLRKNMRVGGTERSFDRKWFDGIPDGRHNFTARDGDVTKEYVVRLTTTTARLQRIS